MTNYIFRGKEFGHNTKYIADNSRNMKIVRSDEAFPNDAEYVIRWGTQAKIPNGPKIINKRRAIKETCNKGQFRAKAAAKGLAPNTWLNIGDFIAWCQKNADRDVQVIVRPEFHSRSEDLFFCKNKQDLDAAIAKIGGNYYISEYIKKDREVRVFVANGRALVVAEKNPKDKKGVTWGCVEEGTLDYTNWEDWEEDILRVAIEAFNLSELDFAAIDVMVKDGKAYFLEANTAPEVWEYYGKTFAKAFAHMTANDEGRNRIPVIDYKNWKNCIHPCMSEKAVLPEGVKLAQAAPVKPAKKRVIPAVKNVFARVA